MHTIKFLVCVSLLLSMGCSSNKAVVSTDQATTKQVAITSPIDELYSMMQGSFDSSAQSLEDESYYDITLHMYPIWTGSDTKYLYVEQSVTSNQAKPYRQRVYKVVPKSDGTIASYVYTLKNDSLYIGKWEDPSYFDNFSTDILDIREGCEVIMTRMGPDLYSGSTVDKNCGSTLRGATYATSKVDISNGKVTSWDQGWNDSDEQVWGATAGPYIFLKQQQ